MSESLTEAGIALDDLKPGDTFVLFNPLRVAQVTGRKKITLTKKATATTPAHVEALDAVEAKAWIPEVPIRGVVSKEEAADNAIIAASASKNGGKAWQEVWAVHAVPPCVLSKRYGQSLDEQNPMLQTYCVSTTRTNDMERGSPIRNKAVVGKKLDTPPAKLTPKDTSSPKEKEAES